MADHPTPEQVTQALNVIEHAKSDDAMVLMVWACAAAVKHGVAKEAADNLEVDWEDEFETVQNAFNPFPTQAQ